MNDLRIRPLNSLGRELNCELGGLGSIPRQCRIGHDILSKSIHAAQWHMPSKYVVTEKILKNHLFYKFFFMLSVIDVN